MAEKKIAVADDHLEWGSQLARLLVEAARTDERYAQYSVTPFTTPDAMCEHLQNDPEVWLAIVDMDFSRYTSRTGLTVLLAAEQIARSRPRGRELHTAVITAEDHDNRHLFLHTAFQCFGPPPVDLIYKGNDFTADALRMMSHLASGGRSAADRLEPFAPSLPNTNPLMRRLLGGPRKKDGSGIKLALWRALSGITAEEGGDAVRGVQRIQQATGFASKHVYTYMDDAFAAAADVAIHMRFPPRSLLNPPERKRANDVIAALREFASAHLMFFQAPELDTIVERFLDPVRTSRRLGG